MVITVGSWKKLDWPRELQTAEITSLSHDRNIHRTQEESRGPIPPQQGVSSERPKGAVRGQFRRKRKSESSSEQFLQ